MTFDPDFPRDQRAEDGRGSFGADVCDVLAQVPTEGVDELGLMGELVLDLESLIADPGEAASGIGSARRAGGWRRRCGSGRKTLIGDGRRAGEVEAAIVVAELNEDEVAGLDEGEGVGPVALRDVGVRGQAPDGSVDDVDLCGIEEVGDGCAPTPEAVGTFAVSVADGGVSDEDERAQAGVGGSGEAEVGFLLGGGHDAAWRSRLCWCGHSRCD